MARSLTVAHEEHATAHPLLTWFVVLGMLWLAAGTVVVALSDASVDAPPPAPADTP